MDAQAAIFSMVDMLLRVGVLELLRVVMWGGMLMVVTTYGVVLQRYLKGR